MRQALSETRLFMQESLVQAAPLLKVFRVGRLLIDVVCRGVRHRGRLGRSPLPGALPRFVLLLPPPPPGLLRSATSESERDGERKSVGAVRVWCCVFLQSDTHCSVNVAPRGQKKLRSTGR